MCESVKRIKNTQTNVLLRIIFGVISIIIVSIFAASHLLVEPRTLVTRTISPTGLYILTIDRNSPFLFGPTNYAVFYKKEKDFFNQKLFETYVNDDGGFGNSRVTWEDSIATIVFSGEEQTDEIWNISFGKKVSVQAKNILSR